MFENIHKKIADYVFKEIPKSIIFKKSQKFVKAAVWWNSQRKIFESSNIGIAEYIPKETAAGIPGIITEETSESPKKIPNSIDEEILRKFKKISK